MRRHQQSSVVDSPRRWLWLAIAVCAVIVLPHWQASAQKVRFALGGDVVEVMESPATSAAATEDGDGDADKDTDALFTESAMLKTDPDIDRLMRRAHELTDDKRYDVAATLWQQVLDRSGSELTTREEWVNKRDELDESEWLQTYKSVRTEVERLLATLPPEGISQYRIVADGPARTLLAAASGDREISSLEEVVRRYFVSSVGDDAAWQLGCVMLDRHDFVGAGRVFEKILTIHPDPSMSREDVMLRLAVCQARSGNRTSADSTYDSLSKVVKAKPSAVPSEAFQLVGLDIQKEHVLVTDTYRASGDWPMTLGSPARDGHMAALDNEALAGNLHESWSHRTEVFDSDAYRSVTAVDPSRNAQMEARLGRVRAMGFDEYGNPIQQAAALTTREDLIRAWKEQLWTPTAKAILVDGKIIFRTPTRLACYDATAVGEPKLLWMAPPDGSLSADGKTFEVENIERLKTETGEFARLAAMSGGRAARAGMADYRSALQFGDRTCQSMTHANNTVYFVDDVPQPGADVDPNMARRMGMATGESTPTGPNRSKLIAIDSITGKILWEFPGEDGVDKDTGDFRFIGPVVPNRRTLLVPVYATGGLWVYAIETEDGKNAAGKRTQTRKLLWKASLCDDPRHGGDRWAPVTMCLDGGDLFVSTGRGVVFALDSASGGIRWAVRYKRTMTATNSVNPNWGTMQQSATFNGWDENYVVARGPWVILMASDYRKLVALNRATGDFAWPGVGIDDVEYVLGVVGDNLYVAGAKVVRAYSLRREGSIDWSVDLDEPSHGRGALTADSIYLPVKDKVHRYDLKGKLLAKANVNFSRDRDDPVGNLYTDGKTLFAVGPDRVHALTNAAQQLKRLDAQISGGDEALKRRRMMLRARANQVAGAVEDLHAVQALIAKDTGPASALAFTAASISEMELVQTQPLTALDLLVGDSGAVARLSAEDRKALSMVERSQVTSLVARALEKIGAKPSAQAMPLILSSIERWPDDSLRIVADVAIKASATPESADLLRKSLGSESYRVRAAATTALGQVLGEKGADEIAKLLGDTNDDVKIAAAKAIISHGDRRALAPLVAMLEADAVTIRHEASRLLLASTGQEIGFIAYTSDQDRAPFVAKWKAWLAANGKSAKLNVPLDFHLRSLGRILVSDFDAGVVRELDARGDVVWTSPKVPGAWGCQGLPNGHRLVTSFQSRYVIEFDREGAEVWRSERRLPFYPTAVERLPNGNTLVAGRDMDDKVGIVAEIGRDGVLIESSQLRLDYKPYDLRMLPTGRMLAACTYDNVVCEYERDGTRVVSSTISVTKPVSARRQLNGHLLVGENGGEIRNVADRLPGVRRIVQEGRVLEYNENYKVTATTSNPQGELRDAERLGSGNLLILDEQSIKEVDSSGKTVWSKAMTGGKRLSVY
jgi:HEAT repeat protein/outer membrane protein assembly factor BamB